MALTFGKTEVKKIAAILNGEHDSAEAAATAVLDAAFEIYEARAKYAVVAQIRGIERPEGVGEEHLDTIVLGPFATAGVATKAGESVAIGNPTKEECRWLLARWWPGSPNAWYVERKEKITALREADRGPSQAERLTAFLRAREGLSEAT